jgi:hypothetical protein
MQIKYNVLVIGSDGVGKSLFIDRFFKSKAYKESGFNITFTETNEVVGSIDNSYDMVIVVASYSQQMCKIKERKALIRDMFNDVPCSVVVTKCDGTFYDKNPTDDWFHYIFCDIQEDYIKKYYLIRQTVNSEKPYCFFDNSTSEYGVWNLFGKLIKKMKKTKKSAPNLANKLEYDINSNYLNKVVGIMNELKARLINSELEKNKLKEQLKTLKETIKGLVVTR